jgi:hypothetical protein
MDGLGYQTQSSDQGAPGMLHVTATLPQVGTTLGLLVAEVPERLQEFLREAALFDQPFKRWEYVRGVHSIPGAGADIVGLLPQGLSYTGFEGYWAGSAMSEEEIVAAEAEQGMQVIHHIAEVTGTTHALAAGLDIFQHPHVRALAATALGHDYCLANLEQLEPVFGELLARLRALAESCPEPDRNAGFQARVAEATQAIGPTLYSDPTQHRLLADLEREGQNILSDGITEHYDIPRAPHMSHHINSVRLGERARYSYRLLSEIGRMGHPVVRALLHIQAWTPSRRERGRAI